MSNWKVQAALTAEFLVSEGNGQISRERIVVKAGAALPAGQVLGVTSTGEYAPYDNAANDGSEVAAAVLYAPLAASDASRRGPPCRTRRHARNEARRRSPRCGAPES
ncbi:head decoration protein, partial [Burkholderia cepacia]|uniref:head decoration protein n=1 Tax=Burkholderia cepacia TaxID=292 RepID=UPI002175824F